MNHIGLSLSSPFKEQDELGGQARLMEFHSSMELTMIINAASKLRISDAELYGRFAPCKRADDLTKSMV